MALAVGIALAAAAPNGPEPAAGFAVAPGLEAFVWARSPLFFNPTSIDVDARGRVFVLEAVDYRAFNTKAARPLWHDGGDRVVVLEDTDGDGAADASHVFVQDEDLVAPLGIAVVGNRVYVSCSPALLVYTDTDGDARFDPAVDRKERLLSGFGGFDHDHSLHAVVVGPDGRLHFPVGNAGPHVVTDRSGFTLRSGSFYTGGSPHNATNTPGLASDDGRVWVGGLALRVGTDGRGLEVVGHNFRNPMGLAVDSFGNFWQSDNDDEISCRVSFLMEGGSGGYASSDGARSWSAERRPGQPIPVAHWRQEDPGVMPAGDVYGPGSPTGMAFYENGALGEEPLGLLLACEAGRNAVWGYRPRAAGAGFALERFTFFSSVPADDPGYVWSRVESDPRKWFRPSDVAIGPDGAAYVADWNDPIVGGHQMKDGAGFGAIYRIARKGAPVRPPKIDLATAHGAAAALASPSVPVRASGREALVRSGEAGLGVVERLLRDGGSPFLRARAVFVAAAIGGRGLSLAESALEDGDERLRVAAFRALRQAGSRVLDHAARLARDGSPAVRREAALALRDEPFDRVAPILLDLAARHAGGDRAHLEAVGTACDGKEEAAFALFREKLAGAGPALEWSPSFADLAWRLHALAAVPDFRLRALAPSLPLAERVRAIDALAFVRGSREAARAVLEAATSGPADGRARAAFWILNRDGNDWRSFGLARELPPDIPKALFRGAPMPPSAEPAFRSGVVRRGAVDVVLDVAGATRVWLVADDAGDGNACDWVDWLDESSAMPRLESIPRAHADTGWGAIHAASGKNCAGLPMRVLGAPAASGIGAHADSVIVLDVAGTGLETFSCRAAVDDGAPGLGGADHESGAASVRFFVYHDGEPVHARVRALRARLLDPDAPEADLRDAAAALGRTREGTLALLALEAKRAIPEAARAAAARAALACPDLGVRALASGTFSSSASSSSAAAAAGSGDASRGRALFFGAKAGCASCHAFAGAGGGVGPDLTAIGAKYDRAALLDSIARPSAAILPGYESVVVETRDGRLFTGFVVADGAVLSLRESSGDIRAIPAAEIASRSAQTVSAMPDAAALGLSSEELADVAEFLLAPPR